MRVLIVDDEPIILKSIENMVKDMKPYWTIDSCLNVLEAQEHFNKWHYDILLTDINLPVISGLELARWCKSEGFSTIIAIISAYSEFDYARTAMSLDIKHYILKPIEDNQFIKVLNRLETESIKIQQAIMQQQLQQHLFVSPQKTYLKNNVSCDQIYCTQNLDEYDFLPIVISMGFLAKTSWTDNVVSMIKQRQFQNSGLENCLNNTLLLHEKILIFDSPYCSKTLVIMVPKSSPKVRINDIISILNTWIKNRNNVSLLIGSLTSHISQLTRLQTQMLSLFPKLISFGKGIIINFNSKTTKIQPASSSRMQQVERKLIYGQFFEKNMGYEVPDSEDWRTINNLWFTSKLSQFEYEFEFKQIRYALGQIVNNNSLIDHITVSLTQALESSINLDDFSRKSFEVIKNIINELQQYSTKYRDHKYILATEIKHHLEKNYRERLTNQDLSKSFSYSAVYLSNIFKDYYQCTPLDYLNKFRIDVAKALLKSNCDLCIAEVGENCGFPDPSYFSRVFKKTTGHSPDTYRKC